MLRRMMLSKLHRARVTQTDLNYVGSITIDKNMLDDLLLFENEEVQVINIDTGERATTYIIEGEAGSGVIGLNGGMARFANVGDKIIVVAYGIFDLLEIESLYLATNKLPRIIQIDNDENKYKKDTRWNK